MNTQPSIRILVVAALAAGSAVPLGAQRSLPPRDLAGQTLEDLLNYWRTALTPAHPRPA